MRTQIQRLCMLLMRLRQRGSYQTDGVMSVLSLGLCLGLSEQIIVYIVSSMFVLMTSFISLVKFSDAVNVYSCQQSDGFCELSGGC